MQHLKLYMNRTLHRRSGDLDPSAVVGVLFFKPRKWWQRAVAYALGHTYTHVSICYHASGSDRVFDWPKRRRVELLERVDFMRRTEPDEMFLTTTEWNDLADIIYLAFSGKPFSRLSMLIWLIAKRLRLPVGRAPRNCTTVTQLALPDIPHNTPDELYEQLKENSARIA